MITASRHRRRRSLAAATSLLALAGATACGSSSASEGSPGSGGGDFSVAYVMSDNLGDNGFNDSAKSGFDEAQAEGVTTKLLEASPDDPQLWRQNLEAASASGDYDVIFTGPGMHDNLAAVAPQNPEQTYVFFDDELDEPNVASVKYAQNEGSYLAGILAAKATADPAQFPLAQGTKEVAVVAGQDLPIIQDFILGFQQGVASVDPTIAVQVSYVDSFNDAQKAYDLTTTAFTGGADVVYNVAGPAGLGILRAAADQNRYAIGVDSDQNGLHPDNVLASMLKNIGTSVYDSTRKAQDGSLSVGELTVYDLSNDGVGLVYNDALVPAGVQEEIATAGTQVADGQVEVDSAFS